MHYPLVLTLWGILSLPLLVGAEVYQPLSDLHGLEDAALAAETGNFRDMINLIYRLSIGLGSGAAVLVIIWAGFQYSFSTVYTQRASLSNRIWMALGGLAVLLGAYLFLQLLNPRLNLIGTLDGPEIDQSNITGGGITQVNTNGLNNQSGISGSEILAQYDAMNVVQYQWLFGRSPDAHRIQDNTVTLNAQELRELLANYNGGITIDGEYSPGERVDDIRVNITPDAQRAVAAAIRLHNLNGTENIPESWADDPALYKIIAKESAGIVGRPNYALEGYMKSRRISPEQIANDIRTNTFYSKHCCRTSSQSGREQRENGGFACNPDTQSGLMDYTQARANMGSTGYGHVAGQCTSATGIGQLLVANVISHYPTGVRGYGTASEEIYGMLSYIKSRYGSPTNAWARYKTGIGY